MKTSVSSVESGNPSIMSMIEALAAISETKDGLTRRYLTAEHRRANDLVHEWMTSAGMKVWQDAAGNVIGRYEGEREGLPAVMIGSHLDTVVNAGRYDGMLGVVTGIDCVRSLEHRGLRLPFAVEVIGFADEEGARFQSTYLGSRAVAGTFDTKLLSRRDQEGTSMADAMSDFGLEPARIGEAARDPGDVLAYLELHIEQGPILEAEGIAAGVVTAIAGATRLAVMVDGLAGHAGTAPMGLRRDALAAASECVLALERIAASHPSTVGTVGQMSVLPGASNVVPGRVMFSIDLRAAEDSFRQAAMNELYIRLNEIAARRNVEIFREIVHEAPSVACSDAIMTRIEDALSAEGQRVLRLASGAGHDAAAMADLTDVGMIFLRCEGGLSHNPDEAITESDALTGGRILLRVLESFGAET